MSLAVRPDRAPVVIAAAVAAAKAGRKPRLGAGGGPPRPSAAFVERYWSSPAAFVWDCIDWSKVSQQDGPTAYQEMILRELWDNRRVAVRGPHGLGKTTTEAWVLLWFALTRDGKDWKAITTAGVWRQLRDYLWPEVRKWARLLRWDVISRPTFDERLELQTLALRLSTGGASAAASDNPSLIEGAHADHLLYIFDEAKAIPAGTFDAAEGAFTGSGGEGNTREAFALACSTPGDAEGRFYEIHERKDGLRDWRAIHVTRQMVQAAGLMTEEWRANREAQWGRESPIYQNRVEGNFSKQGKDSVIPLDWVEAAIERWRAWVEGRDLAVGSNLALPPILTSLGVDVGNGGDLTVLAPRYGWIVDKLVKYGKGNPMETAGRIVPWLRGLPNQLPEERPVAIIDSIGIGAGVYARVLEQGLRAIPFNAAERATRHDRTGEIRFANKRAQLWWQMRELLDPTHGEPVGLPDDDDLVAELTAPRYRVLSGGSLIIEAKADIIRRLRHSTDSADAVIMSFMDPTELELSALDDDLAAALAEYRGT